MDIETVRTYCLSLSYATEDIQWGDDLLFRVGGKIFAGVPLDASAPNRLSFKCTPEKYAELIELDGIIPAPYSARFHWVAIRSFNALDKSEIEALIKESYDLVFAKLPKKLREGLHQGGQEKKPDSCGWKRKQMPCNSDVRRPPSAKSEVGWPGHQVTRSEG